MVAHADEVLEYLILPTQRLRLGLQLILAQWFDVVVTDGIWRNPDF